MNVIDRLPLELQCIVVSYLPVQQPFTKELKNLKHKNWSNVVSNYCSALHLCNIIDTRMDATYWLDSNVNNWLNRRSAGTSGLNGYYYSLLGSNSSSTACINIFCACCDTMEEMFAVYLPLIQALTIPEARELVRYCSVLGNNIDSDPWQY